MPPPGLCPWRPFIQEHPSPFSLSAPPHPSDLRPDVISIGKPLKPPALGQSPQRFLWKGPVVVTVGNYTVTGVII